MAQFPVPRASARSHPPSILKHLKGFEKDLRARYEVRRGDYEWWVIRQVAETAIFDNPKIVYPDLCSRPTFAFNTDGVYPNNTVFCIASESAGLLGFLNSKLAWYWIAKTCPANRGGAYRLCNQYINQIPLCAEVIENSELASTSKHILELRKASTPIKNQHSRALIERQVLSLEERIDKLIYELYGLTDDEIQIVEEATAKPAELRRRQASQDMHGNGE